MPANRAGPAFPQPLQDAILVKAVLALQHADLPPRLQANRALLRLGVRAFVHGELLEQLLPLLRPVAPVDPAVDVREKGAAPDQAQEDQDED